MLNHTTNSPIGEVNLQTSHYFNKPLNKILKNPEKNNIMLQFKRNCDSAKGEYFRDST